FLSLAGVGVQVRAFLLLSLAAYFCFFSQLRDAFHVHNKIGLFPATIVALLMAPGVSGGYAEPSPVWGFILLATLPCAAYVNAGICKLRCSGRRWMTGDGLRVETMRQLLSFGKPLAAHFVKSRRLATAAAVGTVIIELGAPLLALTSPVGFALLALGMHA